MRNYTLQCICLAAICVATTTQGKAAALQTSGHTDIRFTYEGGVADLVYYLDQGSVVDGEPISVGNPVGGTPVTVSGGQTKITYQPDQLAIYVAEPSIARPAGATWDFLGVAAGEPLWYLPQLQDPAKPWPGISTESLSSAEFSNVRYQLTGFSGPGALAVTQTSAFGTPNVFYQTSNGLSELDKIDVPTGTHAHYNWFFTQPGTYELELTAIGTLRPAVGGGTVSVTDTLTFHVVDVPQIVPEPAGLMLAALGLVVGVVARRRNGRNGL